MVVRALRRPPRAGHAIYELRWIALPGEFHLRNEWSDIDLTASAFSRRFSPQCVATSSPGPTAAKCCVSVT
ncbi:hypothetical protein BLAT2472_40438 [Burkholderia latens]|nr:hypothetical protein WK25_21350 [Burkholderia latens]